MDETEFPESSSHFEYVSTYEAERVEDWLRRCMNDFPQKRNTGLPVDGLYIMRYYRWFNKWFSQFRKE